MRGEHDDRIPGWLRATLGTLGDVVVFAALSLVIWTVLPAVALGATPVIIGGGSMSPLIRAGDLILLDDTPPPTGEMFAPGTVITFEEPADPGQLVTHRVASIADRHYVTRGDANASDDPRPVNPDQLVGVGRWLVPAIGLPAHWARTGAWHLVALTVLGGAAAVAASLAGRPRVAIEVTDQAGDDLPLELPEVAPAQPGVAEPAFADPVLAFNLEPEPAANLAATPGIAPDTEHPEQGTEDDDERLDPAAAERAAVAAQAARRSMAGLDRVRDEQEEQGAAVRGAGRRDQHDSAGSAPVAAVLAIATALIASTLVPSFAAATYVAATTNPTNSFSVAEAPSTSTFALLHGGGGNFITEGNPNNVTRFVPTEVVPAQTLTVEGNLVVNLAILQTRGAHKSVEVIVDIDGQAVSATATGLTSGARQLVLDPQLDMVIPGGTSITIEIISRGVDLEGDGASTITFPG